MASRKEEKERRRQERLAAEQAAAQQTGHRRTYGIIVGAVLVLAVVGAIVAIASGGKDSGGGDANAGPEIEFAGAVKPPPANETDLFDAARKAGCVLKNPPIEGQQHVPASEKLKYSTNPAVSGNHDALPQPDGAYSEFPQPRHTLHALEHGRVAIMYDPKLPQKRINQLGGIYNEDSDFMLIMPNPTMKADVAVAAWGHLATCKKISNETFDVVRTFVDRYRAAGPEPPEAQPAAGTPQWPGEIPPFHIDGNTTGS